MTGGNLEKVLRSIEIFLKSNKVWVEITTLIIPGLNDSKEELKALASWIASMDKNIPWHISRFFPHYLMQDRNPTPLKILEEAYETGKKEGLNFIYLGNVISREKEDTYCPDCGKKVIKRSGFFVESKNIKKGKCSFCGTAIPGVWS